MRGLEGLQMLGLFPYIDFSFSSTHRLTVLYNVLVRSELDSVSVD
jgi:hypothetical protein